MTTEDLKEKYLHHMTVGDLLDFIEEHKIPRESKILAERVTDYYFTEGGWDVIKKPGSDYYHYKQMIEKAKPGGEFHNKEDYPKMTDGVIQGILDLESELDKFLDEFHPIWWACKFPDDNNLYLNLHY